MKLYYLFLIFCIVFTACQKEVEEENIIEENFEVITIEEEESDIITLDTSYIDYDNYGPFPIGSVWYYEHLRTVVSDLTLEVDTYLYFTKLTVIDDTIFEGTEFLKFEVENYDEQGFDSVPTENKIFYRTAQNGEHFSISELTTDWLKNQNKFLDINQTPGYEWYSDTISYTEPNIGDILQYTSYRIEQTETTLEVNGETYTNLIKISSRFYYKIDDSEYNFPIPYYNYYAPGIGLICSESAPPFQKIKVRLLEYSIGPP